MGDPFKTSVWLHRKPQRNKWDDVKIVPTTRDDAIPGRDAFHRVRNFFLRRSPAKEQEHGRGGTRPYRPSAAQRSEQMAEFFIDFLGTIDGACDLRPQ